MSSDPRHRLGQHGETLAAEHLQRCGYRIVERNFRTRWGELDIVAHRDRTLVFCEVKTRQARSSSATARSDPHDPLAAVRAGKRTRLRRMAVSWLATRADRPYAPELRFDAIGITLDPSGALARLEHLEGAF